VHGLARRITESVDVTFTDAGQHLGGLFGAGRTIIALMAAGAVIRLLAPQLGNKTR
jgi:cobalt-precorrin 5A hydrolase/precorrin-3B C17-methyltransferase